MHAHTICEHHFAGSRSWYIRGVLFDWDFQSEIGRYSAVEIDDLRLVASFGALLCNTLLRNTSAAAGICMGAVSTDYADRQPQHGPRSNSTSGCAKLYLRRAFPLECDSGQVIID